MHPVERAQVGALEGIDRLFLVTDDEDRPVDRPRALPRGEFLRQPLDHRPLRRAGVLRLVHQDMVDPAIQPEQHPLRHRGIGQQPPRAQDQVVEIQPSQRRLARFVFRQERAREPVQRRGALSCHQRHPSRPRRLDPPHQVFQRVHQGPQRSAQVFRRQRADLGAERLLGLLAVQQHALQRLQIPQIRLCQGHICKLLGVLCIGRLAAPKRLDHAGKPVRFVPQENLCQQIGVVETRGQTEHLPHRLGPQRRGKGRAVAGDFGAERREILVRQEARHAVHDAGLLLGQPVHHLLAQQRRAPFVHLDEGRRHPCLQREAAEQRRAKCVDRLDLQPARRLDRTREKPACPCKGVVADAAFQPKFGQRGPQRALLQHRPFAQPLEQPVLHLAGRRLGVGQAQDALRLDPFQQEPRHPVGQHPRLARPGIRRQPCRGAGVGSLNLPLAGGVPAHASSSRPTGCRSAGALRSHSPNRARWS